MLETLFPPPLLRRAPGGPDLGLLDRCCLLVSVVLSYLSLGTVILSAEALALRRAKQAQRRAQQTALQLSKEQKVMVQILLDAHTRHVRTMFDQFVQFRVSTLQNLGWEVTKREPKKVAQGKGLCSLYQEMTSLL